MVLSEASLADFMQIDGKDEACVAGRTSLHRHLLAL